MRSVDDYARLLQPHLEKGEDFSVKFFHRTRDLLPIVARILLVSSYLEDCIRIIFRFDNRISHLTNLYGLSPTTSTFYWIFVLALDLVACSLILSRKRVPVGCCMLLCVLSMQVLLVLTRYMHLKVLFRLLAQFGALLLCWAEWHVTSEKKSTSNAFSTMLPSIDGGVRKPQNMLQLAGRFLITLMFLNVLELDIEDLTTYALISNVLAISLTICIVVGYRTQLAALALIVFLFFFGVTHYAFWLVPPETPWTYDVAKRSFFLVLNLIGGLMIIVSIGAGDVSLDRRRAKKGL